MALSERERRRRKRKRRKRKLIFCGIVELLVITILFVICGWNYGVGDAVSRLFPSKVSQVSMEHLKSPYAVLMDVKTGKLIGERKAQEKIYPASMTKIMTAIVAIENLTDLETIITLSPEMFQSLYEEGASRAGFELGEEVRAIDLLYGLLLPSGGECGIGLAQYISGSEEAFVSLMNQKAEELGLKNTHFCDSTGLHNPEHYSTPEDIAKLFAYALKNDTFRQIITSGRYSTAGTNLHPEGLTFYSTLFTKMTDTAVTGGNILGGKTGYTSDAGHCLASFAQIQGKEYILVTAGASGDVNAVPHIEDAFTEYNELGKALEGA